MHAAATKPLAAVTLIPAPAPAKPVLPLPGSLRRAYGSYEDPREPETERLVAGRARGSRSGRPGRRRPCRGCRSRRRRSRGRVDASSKSAISAAVRVLDARELGRRRRRGGRGRPSLPAYASSSSARRSLPVATHVARHEQAAAHRQQVRDEADREAERLRDLRRVLVPADRVRREVLEHEARMRARLQLAARARDARLRVDHDARRVDRARDRRQREQRGCRVAARVGDRAARSGGKSSGKRVRPVAEPAGPRVLEAVPRRVERGVAQPVRAGEIDDDRAAGGSKRGRALVRRGRERRRRRRPRAPLRSWTKRRRDPFSRHGRGRTPPARERVGAERDAPRAPDAASTRSSVSCPA